MAENNPPFEPFSPFSSMTRTSKYPDMQKNAPDGGVFSFADLPDPLIPGPSPNRPQLPDGAADRFCFSSSCFIISSAHTTLLRPNRFASYSMVSAIFTHAS